MTRKFSPLSDDDNNEDDFGKEYDTYLQLSTHEKIVFHKSLDKNIDARLSSETVEIYLLVCLIFVTKF